MRRILLKMKEGTEIGATEMIKITLKKFYSHIIIEI